MSHPPIVDLILTLIGMWLLVSMLAWMLGGQKCSGPVFMWPFLLFGWVAREVLVAMGRGIVRVARDAHNYFYGRWPGRTILGYAIFVLFVGITGWLKS